MKKKIKQDKGIIGSIGLGEMVPYKRWPQKATLVR